MTTPVTSTTTPTPTVTVSDHRLRTYGLVGAVASLVGAVCAVVIIACGPMVAEDRFSYPFDAGWFAAWQVVFAVQHAAMLPLFAGLLILERRHPSRALRIGTWVALAGQVALIESIEQDYEGRNHLAVVLEHDPGRDLGMLRQPGHRFCCSAEEVEPLKEGES